MKKIYSLLSVLFVSSSFLAQQTNKTIDINGVTRTYVEYIPVGYNPLTEKVPLIIVMHGLGDNGANMALAGFNQIADTARFIVLYPDGVSTTTIAGTFTSWNNGTLLSSTADDIGLMSALMEYEVTNNNINESRIYATGFSMGSIMSYHLACEMNDRIAAIACMSGTMSTSDIANCVATYKTPVLHMHGTADGTVPYNGGLPSLSSVAQTINFWQPTNGCDLVPDSMYMPNLGTDNYITNRFIYKNCDGSSALEFWRIDSAAHEYMLEPVNDYSAPKEAWHFFYQHSNPAATQVGITENSIATSSIYPNPATDIVHLDYSQELDRMYVLNMSGKLVYFSNKQDKSISVNTWEKGIYFLTLEMKNGEKTTKKLVVE
ncbi:MAG: T9SS type A sorting domain-containing protein [Crocinitomicaceae bacterium]